MMTAFVSVCCAIGLAAAESGPQLNVSVDYAGFLNRSDLIWAWDKTEANPPPSGWWSVPTACTSRRAHELSATIKCAAFFFK